MRRMTVIVVLLICASSPIMVFSSANLASIDDSLDVQSSDEHIIHRGETIEASITVRNQADETTIIDFTEDLPNNISIANLPSNFTLIPDQVRQFRFYFTCDYHHSYGTVLAYVNITSNLDSTTQYTSEFRLIVSKQSDLRFGVSEDSQFVVDPGLRTNLAVNMTNFGEFQDHVNFSITTNSGWLWGWNMDDVQNGKAMELFQIGQLKFARLWIDIPQVIDSNPLHMSGPRFTLTATSSLDRAEVTWNFDLLMSEFRNVTLDNQGDNLQLDPDSNDRIPITIKNSGNVENRYDLELQIIDSSGNAIDGVDASDRISYNGWIVAIFGGYEGESLMPTDKRTFEIGFQSPNQNFGVINVRLNIIPVGAVLKSIEVDLTSEINWNRDFATELISQDCHILPLDKCNPKFRIHNHGNYQDEFKIEAIEIPTFVTLENAQKSLEIPKDSHLDITDIIITANQGAKAFSNSQVVFKVQLADLPSEFATVAIDVTIAQNIDWSLQDLSQENDSLGRFNIAMTLRNDGNAADGIIVQLQCSHFTPMALIPPLDSVTEAGVEFPRSFEVNNIEFGSNITVRAWAEIPTDQTSNGTMYLNISIRSTFSPDAPMSFTTEVDYIGVLWQKDISMENEENFAEMLSKTVEFALAWKWIILSIILSSLIIGKSFIDRSTRNKQKQPMNQLTSHSEKSESDDWMAKFSKKPEVEQVIYSPKTSPHLFELGFKGKSNGQKPVTAPVEEQLRNAANIVLHNNDKNSVGQETNELLDSISIDGIDSTAMENSNSVDSESNPNMTEKNDPLELPDNQNLLTHYTKQVSLRDDDLDI